MNGALTVDLDDPVLRWLVLALVQTSMFAVVGLLAARLLRRDPATRHAILLCTLVAIAFCPLLTIGLQRVGWTVWKVQLPDRLSPWSDEGAAVPVDETSMANDINRTIDTVAVNGVSEDTEASSVLSDRADDTALPLSALQYPSGATGRSPGADRVGRLSQLGRLALALWAAGCGMLLLRLLAGTARVHQLRRAATPADDPKLTAAVDRVGTLFGLDGRLEVLVSERIGTALAAGIFRPTVFVPRRYVATLSTDELTVVLTHEAAHVIRRDMLIGVWQRVAAILYWLHPLVHVLNRRLATAREEICDNHVLGQYDPARYANVLLRLAEFAPQGLAPQWSAPSGTLAFLSGRWKLEDRVAGLLDARRRCATIPRRRASAAFAGVLLVVAVVLAGIAMSDQATAAVDAPEVSVAEDGVTQNTVAERAGAEVADSAPLPGGARVRLGDNRLRHFGWDKHVDFSADGSRLITSGEGRVKIWNSVTGQLIDDYAVTEVSLQHAQLTPDRTQLAVMGYKRGPDSGVVSNDIVFFNTESSERTREITWQLEAAERPSCFAITPDGESILIGESGGELKVRTLETGEVVSRHRIDRGEILAIAPSPDGELLAIASTANRLYLWNWLTDKGPEEIAGGNRWIGLTFSPDGKLLVAGLDSRDEVQIWDVARREQIRSLRDEPVAPISAEELAFTPDGKYVLAANHVGLSNRFVGAVLMWDVASGELVRRFTATGMRPRALDISPDGRFVAAADWDTNVQICNLATGESIGQGQAPGHSSRVRRVVFTPSSSHVLTASDDHTARLWDAASGQEVARLKHERGCATVAVSADGTMAATAGHDDTVIIWNLPQGTKRHEHKGPRRLRSVYGFVFSADGSELIGLTDDLLLCRWATRTGEVTSKLPLRPSGFGFGPFTPANNNEKNEEGTLDRETVMLSVKGQAISPDGKHAVIVSGRQEYQYWVFDLESGEERFRRELPFRPSAIAVSPDGRRIVVGGLRRRVKTDEKSEAVATGPVSNVAVYDLESGDSLWTIDVPARRCGPVRFSADGRMVAVRTDDAGEGTIKFFDAADGEELYAIRDTQPVQIRDNIAFSPDGRSVAIAQKDASVLIWNLADLTR